MKLETGRRSDARQAFDQVVENLLIRREVHLEHRSSEIENKAGELKYGIDRVSKEKWFQDLCSVLKANDEVVICSQTFLNRGYPHKGQCFFVATGDGLRVGFEDHDFPFPASHHHFRWPELSPGELLPNKQSIPPNYYPEREPWATLSIRHRAPSSLMGLRRFDYKFAAEDGVEIRAILRHLFQAVEALQDRYAA